MKRMGVGAIVGVLSFAGIGYADLISVDYRVVGDGLITRDSASSLDWLDITETVDRSHNYVNSQFGAGGEFEGWRHATRDEFLALLFEAGLDGLGGSPSWYGPANTLLDLLGTTGEETGFPYELSRTASGWLRKVFPSSTVRDLGRFQATEYLPGQEPFGASGFRFIGSAIAATDFSSLDFHSPDTGNWLVRTSAATSPAPVPEPGCFTLLAGIALARCALGRRRR